MTAYSQGDPRQKIQLCTECDQPTGSCEEDHAYNYPDGDDGDRMGPVCSACHVPTPEGAESLAPLDLAAGKFKFQLLDDNRTCVTIWSAGEFVFSPEEVRELADKFSAAARPHPSGGVAPRPMSAGEVAGGKLALGALVELEQACNITENAGGEDILITYLRPRLAEIRRFLNAPHPLYKGLPTMSLTPSERNLADAYERTPGNPMSGASATHTPEDEFCLYAPTGWEQYPRKEWATACGLKVTHNCENWNGTEMVPTSDGRACMKCKRAVKYTVPHTPETPGQPDDDSKIEEAWSRSIPTAARIKLEEAQAYFYQDRKLGTVVKVKDQRKVWDCLVMAKSFLGEAPETPAPGPSDLQSAGAVILDLCSALESVVDVECTESDEVKRAWNNGCRWMANAPLVPAPAPTDSTLDPSIPSAAPAGAVGLPCWVMWNASDNTPWDPPNPPMIWLTKPPPLVKPLVWVRMVPAPSAAEELAQHLPRGYMEEKDCRECGKPMGDPVHIGIAAPAPTDSTLDPGEPVGDCASCGHPQYQGATQCHCGGEIVLREDQEDSTLDLEARCGSCGNKWKEHSDSGVEANSFVCIQTPEEAREELEELRARLRATPVGAAKAPDLFSLLLAEHEAARKAFDVAGAFDGKAQDLDTMEDANHIHMEAWEKSHKVISDPESQGQKPPASRPLEGGATNA